VGALHLPVYRLFIVAVAIVVGAALWLALAVADRLHILSRGRIVHTCTPAELAADDAVKSRYLGV
jgi:ABC-type branched-subunit amino acid transport system ATPase component